MLVFGLVFRFDFYSFEEGANSLRAEKGKFWLSILFKQDEAEGTWGLEGFPRDWEIPVEFKG